MDADADAQRLIEFAAQRPVELIEPLGHHARGGERLAAGRLGLACDPEQRHDAVADKFVYPPSCRLDGAPHGRKIAVQDEHDVIGEAALGNRGEAADVGKQDRDLALAALREIGPRPHLGSGLIGFRLAISIRNQWAPLPPTFGSLVSAPHQAAISVSARRWATRMSETIPRQRADRRQLQQIIAGLTEGVILVDPDQGIVWANDAALAMHGVKTVEELGATARDYRARFELRYRNNHRLSKGDYPLDRVLAGEVFEDVVVEVARVGEVDPQWVHRIRSLVLADQQGNAKSLVLVIEDVTERVNAEERFERAFNANPAPAVICRLSDLRYIKVNHGFQEMTGYNREDLIGRSAYEVDVLTGAENRDLAIERLHEGRTIPQMEATLPLPGRRSKFVIVAGQPIEISDEGCMLFTFIDLEPRKKAEAALRQSEERFAKAFKLSPMPTIVSTLDEFRFLEVNDAFVSAIGYAEEEVIGRNAAQLHLWADPGAREHLEHSLEKTGSVRNMELQMRTKGGGLLDCLVSADIVTIHSQSCVLQVFQDITARKRSETDLAKAIEAVMQDASWFSQIVVEKLANLRQPQGSSKASLGLADLTPREREVLDLMCQGLTDNQIAEELSVSRNTVRNHVATIYGKLDVHRRSSAIVWARDRGFIGDRMGSEGTDRRRSKR